MTKCFTAGCKNRITDPHQWNNFDLWCAGCHAKARGGKESIIAKHARLNRQFQVRCSRDGHRQRGGAR